MKIKEFKEQKGVIPAKAGIHGSRIKCGMTPVAKLLFATGQAKKYLWLLGLVFLLFNFILPKTVLATTYADAAKKTCKDNKSHNENTNPSGAAAYWAKGPCIGIITGTTDIWVDIVTGDTAIDTNKFNVCSGVAEKWINVNPDCSSTMGSQGVNVNDTIGGSTDTTKTDTATTPDATTTTPTAAENADANPNWQGDMPVNANTYNTDWLAVILSVIIGILAITLPFGMMSEVTNAVKGAYNNLTKGTGKWIADKSGLSTQAKKGLYAFREKPMGKKIATWYNRRFGEGKRAEEALQKQTGDIQAEASYDIYLRAKAKAKGDDKALSPYLQQIGKSYGGKNLEKVTDLAAGSTAGFLADQVKRAGGLDMIRGVAEADGDLIGNARKIGKAGDISSGIGALIRQLSDPTKREDAQKALDQIADSAGVTTDQLMTMDLRTFNLGGVVDRPGAPAVNASDMQGHVKALRDDFKETKRQGHVVVSPQGTAATTAINARIGRRTTEETARARNLSDQLTIQVEEAARRRGITNDQAANTIDSEATNILGMIDVNPQEAIERAKGIGLAAYQGMDAKDLRSVLERTQSFSRGYASNFATHGHAGAAAIGASAAAATADARTKITEATKALSRVAGLTINEVELTALRTPGAVMPAGSPLATALTNRTITTEEITSLRNLATRLPV